jgi:antitoxin (DNA-binding transcriptional repressor) of toxin-antitoxin stability system
MITVNMHEVKSRLTQLMQAAEDGQEVILCRKGEPRLLLSRIKQKVVRRDLSPEPTLQATLAPGYDPAEPLSEDEWPLENR